MSTALTGSHPGGLSGDAVFTPISSPLYNATMGDLGTDVLPYAPSVSPRAGWSHCVP